MLPYTLRRKAFKDIRFNNQMLEYKTIIDNKELKFQPGSLDYMDSFIRFTEKEVQDMITEGSNIPGRYSAGIVGYRTCWAYTFVEACNITLVGLLLQ